MNQTNSSKMVKGGSRTFFFDVKEAKNGKRYLQITESRWNKQENNSKRSSIFVFPEDRASFQATLEEMAGQLSAA